MSFSLRRSSSILRPLTSRSHFKYAGPGKYRPEQLQELWKRRDFTERKFTVGIGGPVGSGKTHLVLELCRSIPNLGVVTNDIFTQEDAEFLTRKQVLPASQIRAVETGGCPHSAIREDVSANLSALEELSPESDLLLVESGGDNLAANFSRELADLTLYVIDVAGGDKVPRKGGPGITESDLLIINKIDLAELVGADLELMERQAIAMRSTNPVVLASVKTGTRIQDIVKFILQQRDVAMQLQS